MDKQKIRKWIAKNRKYCKIAGIPIWELEEILNAQPESEGYPFHALMDADCDCKYCQQYYNRITKRKIEEYIENGLPIKYNAGAPIGWKKGIAYKHELVILGDCIDWLDSEETKEDGK
jgi:hypothetical protein